MALLKGCGSSTILSICDHLYDRNTRYRNLAISDSQGNRDTKGQHAAIAEAALDRDADLAASLLLQHYRKTGAILWERLQSTDVPLGAPFAPRSRTWPPINRPEAAEREVRPEGLRHDPWQGIVGGPDMSRARSQLGNLYDRIGRTPRLQVLPGNARFPRDSEPSHLRPPCRPGVRA